MSKSRALHNREQKKTTPTEYRYGRGGRQTTTDKSVADRGRAMPVTFASGGQSGSLKVQSMKKKQQAYEDALSSTKSKKKR